jgi:hypothetical protein
MQAVSSTTMKDFMMTKTTFSADESRATRTAGSKLRNTQSKLFFLLHQKEPQYVIDVQ